MSFFTEIKDSILWDFRIEDEYKNRQLGYAFVIDVCRQTPQLAVYIIKQRLSKTQTLIEQPPQEMMIKAVEEQGGSLNKECLYNVNDDIRQWLKENVINPS